MNPVKKLIQELPYIVKAKEPEAKSRAHILIYEDERLDKMGVGPFAWKKDYVNNARLRLAPIEIQRNEIGDLIGYEFAMNLLTYCALHHRSNKENGLTNREIDQKEKLKKYLNAFSGQINEINEIEAIISIEYAERGWWYD